MSYALHSIPLVVYRNGQYLETKNEISFVIGNKKKWGFHHK